MTEPMPTSYDTSTKTTSSSSRQIGVHKEYLRTIPGILKIVEMVLDLIVIICISILLWNASGWLGFLYGSALVFTLILFCFYLFGLITKLPGPWPLIVFIYYIVYTVLMLITSIILAVHAPGIASIGAAAFFSFADTAVYAADTFFMFREWRSGGPPETTTMTTTTVTTVESAQY